MIFKRRSAALGVALTALVISTLAATEPPAAAAPRSAAASSCDTTPVFFGLHGMAEGPSNTISTISPELESFDTDQNAISGAVLTYPVSYPTVYPNKWYSLLTTPSALSKGENALQADIKSYTAGCSVSQDKIALVGYSMGAWVINKWIVDHPLEWDMIKAVVLYGDPCKVNGKDKGLVREFAASYGCMPAKDYPYPLPGGTTAVPFPVQSWTMPRDPVTGPAGPGTRTPRSKRRSTAPTPRHAATWITPAAPKSTREPSSWSPSSSANPSRPGGADARQRT